MSTSSDQDEINKLYCDLLLPLDFVHAQEDIIGNLTDEDKLELDEALKLVAKMSYRSKIDIVPNLIREIHILSAIFLKFSEKLHQYESN